MTPQRTIKMFYITLNKDVFDNNPYVCWQIKVSGKKLTECWYLPTKQISPAGTGAYFQKVIIDTGHIHVCQDRWTNIHLLRLFDL